MCQHERPSKRQQLTPAARLAQPKFNIIYLLAWESLYQLLTVAFFFWADLIPGFGTSKDIAAFGEVRSHCAWGRLCLPPPLLVQSTHA